MTPRVRIRLAARIGWVAAAAVQAVLVSRLSVAETVPAPGAVDSRIRSAPYDGDQVYRVRGFVGYQIDFEFEPGETFVGLGAGDIEGLSYFGQENHLFLKPKAAKVATNLTVLTNRRRYQIDYVSVPERPSPDDPNVIFTIRFIYPPIASPSAAERAAKAIESALSGAAATRPRNVDYWYCGSPELKPIAASDDGVHTRLRFGPNAELPAVFVRNADGSESLLNFSMDEGDVIIHRVAHRLILRRGRLTGCIANQGFNGAGLRLESGTVAPNVERRVPGVAP
ncbi:MAG TPA: TrbG/VirB9 family P-type conjugative transfer protein [Steroidobacteraceae bacterium]|nr:TrbG/VirB9 family P-type conjugative transfer protein [Steroidobacteraceae bacterium]